MGGIMKLSDIDQLLLMFNPTRKETEVAESKKDEETFVRYNRNNRGLTLWINRPIEDVDKNTIYDEVSAVVGPEIDSIEDLIPRFKTLQKQGVIIEDSLRFCIDTPKEGKYKGKIVFQLLQECEELTPFDVTRHLYFFKPEVLSDDLKVLQEYGKDIKGSKQADSCVEGLSMREATEKALIFLEAFAKAYDLKKYTKEGFLS